MSDEAMSQRFHVIYDGKALDEHLMDVRDLSPAMLAMSDLLSHVNQEINGDKIEIQLKVKANFKAGSFGIEFHEVLSWASKIKDLLSGQTATALANASGILALIGLIYGSRYGLIQLFKQLKGKKPLKIEDTSHHNAKVYYTETEHIEVSKDVIRLYRNKTIVADLNKVLEPLQRDGIDSFNVVSDDDKQNVQVQITSDELDYFQYQEVDDSLDESMSETYLQIESLTFKEKNKWKFNNGESTINASILDEIFLQQIDDGTLRFGKGDLLKVQLKSSQTFVQGKLKTEFEIIKVLEHKIVKQGHFDF